MKSIFNVISICLLLFLSFSAKAQVTPFSQWTWVKGDNIIDQLGIYGIQGTAAPTNKPGGRNGSVTWTDAFGNFWLFGGSGYPASGGFDRLNDLWKYNPSTNEWTWVKGDNTINQLGVYGIQGTPAPANKPGGRSASVSWKDAFGNFWLFGGFGFAASGGNGNLNDLWKYNPSTNEWTWVKGDNTINQFGIYGTQGTADAANKPGARAGSFTWTDASGNLWLFGGTGYAASGFAGRLNDLWKYNPSTNQWTWIKGDNTIDQFGIYGTQGTAAASNKPGGRGGSTSWIDAAGTFWLFGGIGYAASGGEGRLNDLWKYNLTANEWTWVKGDNTINQFGIYGTQGTAAATNKLGGRYGSITCIDAAGNFWFFGGEGYAASGSLGRLNDLWKYNPSSNQWTWIKGDNTINQLSIYGTQGTTAVANKPGARSTSVSWTDALGNFWLLGGFGFAASGGAGNLNDLWKFSTTTYKFTGNGDWDIPGNWLNNLVGPKNIPAGSLIIIDNIPGGQADVTGNINIQLFGQLTINPTKKLNIINGNLANAGLLDGTGTLAFSGGAVSSLSSSGAILTPLELSNKQMFLTGNTNTNAISLFNGSNIRLDGFDLKMDTGTLVADNLNYFITNGNGRLNRFVSSTPVLFPVGKSIGSYTPAIIINTGTNDHFSVRVGEGVTTTGRTQDLITTGNVNRTWYVRDSIVGGSPANLMLQWNQADEQGGFDRTQSYISHFQSCPPPNPPYVCGAGFYDLAARTAALGNDPFTQTRNSISNYNSPSFIVTSRDPDVVYTFINMNANGPGNGNWNDPLNWTNGLVPPNTITPGMEVVIDPVSGQCNFTGILTILPGGKLIVKPGKVLNMQ